MRCPACKARLKFDGQDVTTCAGCKTRVARVPGVAGAKFVSDPEKPWFSSPEELKSAIVRQVELLQKTEAEKKAEMQRRNADIKEIRSLLLDMTEAWNKLGHGKINESSATPESP